MSHKLCVYLLDRTADLNQADNWGHKSQIIAPRRINHRVHVQPDT